MRPGGEGRAEDAVATWGPWGFEVGDVTQPVVAWYGGKDTNVPPEHFEHLRASLPTCEPRFNAEDAHDCVYPRWQEILATVVSSG